MTMWRGLGLFGALVALALLGASDAGAQSANLVVQVSTEPPGLDLTASPASAIAGVVFYNVQEALIKVDRHGKLVPWLAERWYTTDSKNYTFFLRKGVRFHNGPEMKAADVKYVFDRAVNPETKHPYRVQYEAIQDVIVKDDYTISVSLKAPDAMFLWTVARQGSVIYPKEAVETLKTQPVGTGPFTVSDWVRGDRIVLAKNKDYWVKGLPHLDRITYRFIPDPNSALAALKSGDVDVSGFGLGPESVDELKKDPRFQVILGDTTNDVTLSLNNTKKPYSDKRVRLAITHAINKDEVLKGAMFGYGKVLGSNVDPLNPYFIDVSKRVAYDPAKAKKLLGEAGYPNGFDGGDLTPLPPYTSLGEAVANYLQPIGIRTRVRTMERAAFISSWREKKLRGLAIGATGAAGNAAARLEPFVTRTGIYAYGVAPELEDLYLRQAKELDRKQREVQLHQLQKAVADRVLTAPIFQQAFLCGVGPRAEESGAGLVQGFPYSAPADDLKVKP